MRDNYFWQPHRTGKFSVKATYNSLVQMDDQARDNVWSGIWKTNLPPRIKHFLWLVLRKKLLTNFERNRRNMSPTMGYTLCVDNQEIIIHVLCDCTVATKVLESEARWEGKMVSIEFGMVKVNIDGKYIGRGFALKFELWAILVGLEVARLRNYSKVIVESGSLDAIEMILGNSVNIPSMTIIRRINEFRRKLQ
ncbi:hypothetical protein Goari_021412 [Gossypium aridum]|uniref:Reverse transcriptase zinc-binding domain-containing protein n=1 Tax=Gossypium aridum TaxID=34290 RepID=A0A7J8YE80_GOSAI|nr:hypothetical protein [Gossypium aridum]